MCLTTATLETSGHQVVVGVVSFTLYVWSIWDVSSCMISRYFGLATMWFLDWFLL